MSEFPQRLLDGYRGFLSGRLTAEQSRYRELAERGQSPEVMVIGCALPNLPAGIVVTVCVHSAVKEVPATVCDAQAVST